MIHVEVIPSGPVLTGDIDQRGATKPLLTEMAELMISEIAMGTPVYTGVLRRSITSAMSLTGDAVKIFAGQETAQYAQSVEWGSKPHWPPIEPLVLWVKAKIPIGAGRTKSGRRSKKKGADAAYEKEARSIAYAIQRRIAKSGTSASAEALYGTRGFRMFERAFEDNLAKLASIAARYGRTIVASLGGQP